MSLVNDLRIQALHRCLCQAQNETRATMELTQHLTLILERVTHAITACHCLTRCTCVVTYGYDGRRQHIDPLQLQLRQYGLRCRYDARVEQGGLTLGIVSVAWG